MRSLRPRYVTAWIAGLAFAAACASGNDDGNSDGSNHLVPEGAGGSASGAAGSSNEGPGGAGVTSFPDGGSGAKGGSGVTSFPDGGSQAGHGGATTLGMGGATNLGQGGTGNAGTTSQGQGGTSSQGLGGSTAQGQGGTTSQGQGGTIATGGTGGTTSQGQGGASATGGTGACVPNCAGKQCGDDGCNGSCAPGCDSSSTCSGGACVTVNQPTWNTSALGTTLTGMALDPASGGLLYVSGVTAGSGWLASVRTENGSIATSVNVGPASGGLNAVRVMGGTGYVVGYGDFGGPNGVDGMFEPFTLGSLAPVVSPIPLYGSTSFDELRDVWNDGAGLTWTTGVSGAFGTGGLGSPWGVSLDGSFNGCGYPVDTSTASGVGRGVAIVGGYAYVLVYADGIGHLLQFVADDSCSGALLADAYISLGAVSTEPKALIVIGSTAYVAGNASDGAAPNGFFAAVDLGTMSLISSYRDVVPERTYDSLGTDGSSLCVGGSQGGTGYVGLWTTGFGSVWPAGGALPAGTDDVVGVACDGSSFYGAATNGGMAKCTSSGTCTM